ncbi:MAG: FtsX-like permease family protein, partial [Saprospiraceae bacterium]|nr:FtsX-like permease family protein [Saprospiraceae bacterium]
NMQNWRVDKDYLRTLGLEMTQGRFFDPEKFPSDSMALVLNERAAELFGVAEQAVGAKVYNIRDGVDGQPQPEDFEEYTVIGVVRNFHFSSLRDNIGALSFRLGDSQGQMVLRFKAEQGPALLAEMERQWKAMAPEQPFSYRFMDDAFARMYASEQRIGTIAGIFALLAVLISCLGLFGLAAFTAEQRTKEIGIRKVLGASVGGIFGLLSRDFLKLVLVALLVAMPLAWYFMQQWLENFAYRIQIGWWVFALAGVAAMAIAVLTVSYQSIKAALANPIKSLRSE